MPGTVKLWVPPRQSRGVPPLTLGHCNRGIESACRAGHPTWLRCSSLKYWPDDLCRRAVPARRLATLSASPYVRRPVLRRPRIDVRSSETGAWAQLAGQEYTKL